MPCWIRSSGPQHLTPVPNGLLRMQEIWKRSGKPHIDSLFSYKILTPFLIHKEATVFRRFDMAMLNSLPIDYAPLPTNPLERRGNLTFQEFATEYLYPNRPVILTDTTAGWRALSRWNADFFT